MQIIISYIRYRVFGPDIPVLRKVAANANAVSKSKRTSARPRPFRSQYLYILIADIMIPATYYKIIYTHDDRYTPDSAARHPSPEKRLALNGQLFLYISII